MYRPRFFRHLSVVLAVIVFTYVTQASANPTHISGSPGVVDGDTLRIGKERIRLHGIDAPESHQNCTTANNQAYACGAEATKRLAEFIGNRDVDCEVRDIDRYKRSVAVCFVGDENINAWMVKSGWAIAYRKYSMDYVTEEDVARAAKAGLWSGEFVNPWDWRKKK